MKQEKFNLGEINPYENTNHLNPIDLENINSDNLFLAFTQECPEEAHVLAAIDGKIYDFNEHVYLKECIKIIYARSFSDIMPSHIWRLVYITNHDIITIDIDDDKYYLIERFENLYQGKEDKQAKERILKNSYISPQIKPDFTRDDLKDITSASIFAAILEKTYNCPNDFEAPSFDEENEHIKNITSKEIDFMAEVLKEMIKKGEIILPDQISIEDFTKLFKKEVQEKIKKYWQNQTDELVTSVNFIASINGNIYNFNTNQYLDLNRIKINYAKPINELLSDSEWHLAYNASNHLTCLALEDSAIEKLIAFECENSDEIDSKSQIKVLKNGYEIAH